jgi:hypothetical protein
MSLSAAANDHHAERACALPPSLRTAFVTAVAERPLRTLAEQTADPSLKSAADEALGLLWSIAAGAEPDPSAIAAALKTVEAAMPGHDDYDHDYRLWKLVAVHRALRSVVDPSFVSAVFTAVDTDLDNVLLLPRYFSIVPTGDTYDAHDYESFADTTKERHEAHAFRGALLRWLAAYPGTHLREGDRLVLRNLAPSG